MKAFICHNYRETAFSLELASHLKRNLEEVFISEEHQQADSSFVRDINEAISRCEVVVILVGEEFSRWQCEEANTAYKLHVESKRRSIFIILLPNANGGHFAFPPEIPMLSGFPILKCQRKNLGGARTLAGEIARQLHIPWRSADDLPYNPHLFSYEKDIIRFFVKSVRYGEDLFKRAPSSDQEENDFAELRGNILNGCPPSWPEVVHWKSSSPHPNKLNPDVVGQWRDKNLRTSTTAAGIPSADKLEQCLSFPEAGPRSESFFPIQGKPLRVAVMVSGGIAPGINAVVDGIVQRHWMHAKAHRYENEMEIYGFLNGFNAFENLAGSHRLLAASEDQHKESQRRLQTSDRAHEGGSILGTSRVDELMDENKRLDRLKDIDRQLLTWGGGVDILYIIGGDGSMKAAHALWNIAQENRTRRDQNRPLSVVAIPKTMDNDILWVWQSFGFLSAVEKAREVVEALWTEVTSNPRLCVVQLFGSDSGFVVSHSSLASSTGHCNLALIPEIEFSMSGIARYLKTEMCRHQQRRIPYGLVVMAETAIPVDALDYIGGSNGAKPLIDIGLSEDEAGAIRQFFEMRGKNKRVQGQTNDALRTAGLKIVSRGLQKLLVDPAIVPDCHHQVHWDKLRAFTNEPRHLLRAIPPSCSDIIIGSRLGTLAVDSAMAGQTDFMISQWLTEYVVIPLKLVVLGRKRIPTRGIFWKSVLAKTGQPADLTK